MFKARKVMPFKDEISDEARVPCYVESGVALRASLNNNTPKIAKCFGIHD